MRKFMFLFTIIMFTSMWTTGCESKEVVGMNLNDVEYIKISSGNLGKRLIVRDKETIDKITDILGIDSNSMAKGKKKETGEKIAGFDFIISAFNEDDALVYSREMSRSADGDDHDYNYILGLFDERADEIF